MAVPLYRVRRNDTFESLSRTFGVPACMIARLNGSSLSPGMAIEIPEADWCMKMGGCSPYGTSPEGSAITHTVQDGETLYSIARKYNTTLRILEGANRLAGKEPEEGSTLKIPQHGMDIELRMAKEEDTVKSLALEAGYPEALIRQINYLSGEVRAGMLLAVPVKRTH